jgi:hypothetical protein
MKRPWYLCDRCHQGQFPADDALDVKDTDFSPGVRRMQAMVGQGSAFDHGREQIGLLAGLEVTAKSGERTAEAIGADMAAGEQHEIRKAVPLDLPVIIGKPIPVLYVEMDGTGVPVVKNETEGRKGKTDGLPAPTREVSWDASSPQPRGIKKATRSAIRIRLLIRELLRRPKSSASVFIRKPGIVAGAARKRKSS